MPPPRQPSASAEAECAGVKGLPYDHTFDPSTQTRLPPCATSARMSSSDPTPPLAITLRPDARASATVAATLTPLSIPSRRCRCTPSRRTPSSAIRRATSTARQLARLLPPVRRDLPVPRVQPHHDPLRPEPFDRPRPTSAGCCTATVPSTTRVAPVSSASSMSASDRSPPPYWIGRPTLARMSASRRRLIGSLSPHPAPFRSAPLAGPAAERESQRTVEVHHVQPLRSLLRPLRGGFGRIVAVGRLGGRVALPQPHDAALAQVDGGKDDQFRHFTLTCERDSAYTSCRCHTDMARSGQPCHTQIPAGAEALAENTLIGAGYP